MSSTNNPVETPVRILTDDELYWAIRSLYEKTFDKIHNTDAVIKDIHKFLGQPENTVTVLNTTELFNMVKYLFVDPINMMDDSAIIARTQIIRKLFYPAVFSIGKTYRVIMGGFIKIIQINSTGIVGQQYNSQTVYHWNHFGIVTHLQLNAEDELIDVDNNLLNLRVGEISEEEVRATFPEEESEDEDDLLESNSEIDEVLAEFTHDPSVTVDD